jgi:two-component system CheB/CheR fusion protein
MSADGPADTASPDAPATADPTADGATAEGAAANGADRSFEALLHHVREARGFDFTGYKRPTLVRRVQKRLTEVGIDSYEAYLDRLEADPEELTALFNTILINVSGFFRDPDTWALVAEQVVPSILERKGDGPVRVWCAGCASGEEVYTLTMLLCESMGEDAFRERVKIFATDVDEVDLEHARRGTYRADVLEDVPVELRERYFGPGEDRRTFRQDLRRCLIFGRNDLVQDAPISRVDLLTCRNTLMYFNGDVQRAVVRRLHFALSPDGFIVLGRAETLLTHSELFRPFDAKQRIFTKITRPVDRARIASAGFAPRPVGPSVLEQSFDLSPVAQVAVDRDGRLTHANQAARSTFGLHRQDLGRPLQDLEISYRPLELRSLIDRAYEERRRVVERGVQLARVEGDVRHLDVVVTPLTTGPDDPIGAAITFTDSTDLVRLRTDLERSSEELATAYEELQSTNEELETTNEELQSTVEELETTNEELHSSNEELETINEELTSANEEMEGTNGALRQRGSELDAVNLFLESILTSIEHGVVVLDAQQRVTVWSQGAVELWGLRPDEVVGFRLADLDIGFPVALLADAVSQVLDDQPATPVLAEATNRRGRRIQCRVTATSMEDGSGPAGVVLVMEDVG